MMMNGEGFGTKRSRPNFRYYAGIRLEGLSKTRDSIGIAGLRDRDLNTGLPEYQPGVLTT
jgi:hypothetical protein